MSIHHGVTSDSQIMLGTASLLGDEATAQEEEYWARAYVNDNPALRWIVAKYVEGGRANRNRHFWSPSDLAAAVDTVPNTPMNMLHKSHYIVGTVTGARYQTEDHDLTLAQEIMNPFDAEPTGNPYIEVVGPLWRYYFPNELATIESAHAEGRLFVSMECVAETARWHTADGEHKDFPYRGPNDASYGEWQTNGNIMQFVNPHFLGTGLIVPPVSPGWGGGGGSRGRASGGKARDRGRAGLRFARTNVASFGSQGLGGNNASRNDGSP